MAKKLDFKVTNNMAKYEACIYGVEATLAAGVKDLLVYGDYLLVISQANEEWEVKEERLKLYSSYLKTLLKSFDKCLFIHLSRDKNQMVDALAMLSSMWNRLTGTTIKPLVIMKTRAPCYGGESVMSTQIGPEEKLWFYDTRSLSMRGSIQKKQIRKRNMLFVFLHIIMQVMMGYYTKEY